MSSIHFLTYSYIYFPWFSADGFRMVLHGIYGYWLAIAQSHNPPPPPHFRSAFLSLVLSLLSVSDNKFLPPALSSLYFCRASFHTGRLSDRTQDRQDRYARTQVHAHTCTHTHIHRILTYKCGCFTIPLCSMDQEKEEPLEKPRFSSSLYRRIKLETSTVIICSNLVPFL